MYISVFISFQNLLTRLLPSDERGATAVEYGLIVALIATVIFAGVRVAGRQLSTVFTTIAGDF